MAIKRLKKRSILNLLLTCILIILSLFEFSSFICQLIRGLFGENSAYSPLLEAESWLFYAFSSLTPIFASLLMFSWLPLFIIKYYLKNRLKQNINLRVTSFDKISSFMHLSLQKAIKPCFFERHYKIVAAFSLMSVFLITIYPYFPALNPTGKFVGVDIPFYAKKLEQLRDLGDFSAIISGTFCSYPDRPLSILLLFLAWRLTWLSALQAAQFSPILLGLTLVLCSFFFARLLGFNLLSASLIMLFTSLSFHITVGMYVRLIANWIALILLYAFWSFIFVALKKGTWRHCLPAIALQGLLLLSHANTWAMSMGIIFVLFLLFLPDWIFRKRGSFECIMLLLILACGILSNTLRNILLNMSLGRVEAEEIAQTSLSLSNLPMFWHTLNISLFFYKGISFINPILFMLAFIGGLTIFFSKDLTSKIFKAFIIASAFPFLLGNQVMQTRIMYNLPLQVFAFLGLNTLTATINQYFEHREAKKLNILLILLAILINLNYAIRCSFILTTLNFFPL